MPEAAMKQQLEAIPTAAALGSAQGGAGITVPGDVPELCHQAWWGWVDSRTKVILEVFSNLSDSVILPLHGS